MMDRTPQQARHAVEEHNLPSADTFEEPPDSDAPPIDEQILTLQWEQLKHDESYHKDIIFLPPETKLKHMALHNAKYTSDFLSAVHVGDTTLFEKALLDAFIISLASANALNQNLGSALFEAVGDAVSLKEAGGLLVEILQRDGTDRLWLARTFAGHNRKFAKACESYDHIEDGVPFKQWMLEANCSLFKTILAEASARKMDLLPLYRGRMREIEAKSIFDYKYRTGAGGGA